MESLPFQRFLTMLSCLILAPRLRCALISTQAMLPPRSPLGPFLIPCSSPLTCAVGHPDH